MTQKTSPALKYTPNPAPDFIVITCIQESANSSFVFAGLNFQSMKSPLELKSFFSKLFCYITWLVVSPDYWIDATTADLQTRPLRQILLFLGTISWWLKNYKLLEVFITNTSTMYSCHCVFLFLLLFSAFVDLRTIQNLISFNPN